MSTVYRHTQFGALIVWTVGSMVLLALGIAAVARPFYPPLIAAAVGALVAFLFHSLTVEIREDRIRVLFGPGLIRKSFPLHAVREVVAVRNRWFYGWGIRWTPHGWLFNVSGLDAVQIRLDSGRQYRIGTDRPAELVDAIRQAAPQAG